MCIIHDNKFANLKAAGEGYKLRQKIRQHGITRPQSVKTGLLASLEKTLTLFHLGVGLGDFHLS